MIFHTNEMTDQQIYHTTTQTLLPRPIAWVLSEHVDGHYNLAPFSYFTAVSSKPPLLVFSVGDKAPNEGKDTKVNIGHNPYFTVHIPSVRHAQAVTESARTLPATESELDHLELALTDFDGFATPRLADCAVAFGCRVHDIVAVKGAPQSLVFGYVERFYISDSIAQVERKTKPDGSVSERLQVNANQLDPLARLGGSEYGGLAQTFKVARPK